MASLATGPIDIDKAGKYPVVLSDALLGKSSNDVFTGIRYNYKADPSNTTSTSLNLQPSDDPTTYDLSLKDNSDKYQYVGSRATGDGQFVLIFDPVKKHFVLHQVDSTFDMNLVSAPWTRDAQTLQTQYPQLEPQAPSQSKPQSQPSQRKTTKTAKSAAVKNPPKRQKAEKVEKPKKKTKEPTPEPDDDSDDGLTIEYPDGPSSYKYQSTPIFQGNVSEPSDSDEDAEGEEVDERNQDVDYLTLPSPANNNGGGLSDEDLELDLEAELERALDETHGNNGESSESEEE